MYKRVSLVKHILGVNNVHTTASISNATLTSSVSTGININKVLVVTKLSRYELERCKYKHCDDDEINMEIRKRGFDVDKLLYYHRQNKHFENKVIHTLNDMGIEVQIANKADYTKAKVDWADIIIPTGGDGTFLLAASRVRDNTKPVVGFNSDPNRSEGYLCLPKKYSLLIRESIERLRRGQFEWLMRDRIRTTLTGGKDCIYPKHLYQFDDKCDSIVELEQEAEALKTTAGQVLPVLALNEVFIGEILSARASHLDVSLNHGDKTGVKCSGICISTGTGSSSWHYSMNRLSERTVSDILQLIKYESKEPMPNVASYIAEEFNKRLVFAADSGKMVYTLRDFITAGVWPNPKGISSRDYANMITVTSYCLDASLVVDGGVSFAFNNGVSAVMELHPKDALRTVIFPF